MAPTTPSAAALQQVERLSDNEFDAFRDLFERLCVARSLPFLPNLVWRTILSFTTFQESLNVRATCTRLRELVRLRPLAVVDEHAGAFEAATRNYALWLARLPRTLHAAVLQPRSANDVTLFASNAWPQLKLLRICDEALVDNKTPVRSTFLGAMPRLTTLESLSLWHTQELADDAFEIVETMTQLTTLHCSLLWKLPPRSLSRLSNLASLRYLNLRFQPSVIL